MNALRPATLPEIKAAVTRLKGIALRTPLIRLNTEDAPAEIYLKMENLQPIGSFKIRPAANIMMNAPGKKIQSGVYTASSGNMAQGVAYAAKQLGISATVLLPENSAANKVAALQRLGATIRHLPDAEWWRVIDEHGHPDTPGLFVHPVAHQDVIAGSGTIGLEILEDLPDVDTVLVPYGGGGLSSGIASAMRELNSNVRILGSESEHCAPLTASLLKHAPVQVPSSPSFISGIGVGRVLDEMWPLVSSLLAGTVTASVEDIAATIHLLFERHRIIAEGAGAAPVAAAMAGKGGHGKVVCVISGGNLDSRNLIDILEGRVPQA